MLIDKIALNNAVATQISSKHNFLYHRPDFLPVLGELVHSLPHLTFHGGRILKSPRFASIYLGSFWNTAKGKNEVEFHNNFAQSLLAGKYTSIWEEYGAGKGKFLGGRIIGMPSPRRISDQEIQELIQRSLATTPVTGANSQTVHTVYLPPGTVLEASDGTSSLQGMAGYHGSFFNAQGKRIYYAALVYSNAGNGIDFTGKGRDNMTITASHEWTEAVTDPNVNSGRLGWYDNSLGEVSDIPINLGLPLQKVIENLDGYYVQKNWSNQDQAVEAVRKSELGR